MKTFREIKSYDTISIEKSSEECKEYFKELVKGEHNVTITLYPPLREGVIKSKEYVEHFDRFNHFCREKVTSYIYFKTIEDENGSEHIVVEFYVYTPKEFDFSYILTLKFNSMEDLHLDNFEIVDYNKADPENLKSRAKVLSNVFDVLLGYICYNKDNPKVIIRKPRARNNSSSGTSSTAPSSNVRTVLLGEKVLYTISASDQSIKSFKQKRKQRHTESWSVVGFKRQYKSGKVVYVKPHVRGTGTRLKKEYTIK